LISLQYTINFLFGLGLDKKLKKINSYFQLSGNKEIVFEAGGKSTCWKARRKKYHLMLNMKKN